MRAHGRIGFVAKLIFPGHRGACIIFLTNEFGFSAMETKFAPSNHRTGKKMPRGIAAKKSAVRRSWTRSDIKELRQHSKNKTPVKAASKAMKRTEGALRQKAFALGIRLGHRRSRKR
jgi:hypothetical protein